MTNMFVYPKPDMFFDFAVQKKKKNQCKLLYLNLILCKWSPKHQISCNQQLK